VRYSEIGISITESNLYRYNQIVAEMLGRMPNYSAIVRGDKDNELFHAYQRPTIGWSLQCELEGYSR
jgi:hypothetical protein